MHSINDFQKIIILLLMTRKLRKTWEHLFKNSQGKFEQISTSWKTIRSKPVKFRNPTFSTHEIPSIKKTLLAVKVLQVAGKHVSSGEIVSIGFFFQAPRTGRRNFHNRNHAEESSEPVTRRKPLFADVYKFDHDVTIGLSCQDATKRRMTRKECRSPLTALCRGTHKL